MRRARHEGSATHLARTLRGSSLICSAALSSPMAKLPPSQGLLWGWPPAAVCGGRYSRRCCRTDIRGLVTAQRCSTGDENAGRRVYVNVRTVHPKVLAHIATPWIRSLFTTAGVPRRVAKIVCQCWLVVEHRQRPAPAGELTSDRGVGHAGMFAAAVELLPALV